MQCCSGKVCFRFQDFLSHSQCGRDLGMSSGRNLHLGFHGYPGKRQKSQSSGSSKCSLQKGELFICVIHRGNALGSEDSWHEMSSGNVFISVSICWHAANPVITAMHGGNLSVMCAWLKSLISPGIIICSIWTQRGFEILQEELHVKKSMTIWKGNSNWTLF